LVPSLGEVSEHAEKRIKEKNEKLGDVERVVK
jgi:hypothetical protein